jgi:hypothetical protein
MNIGGCDSNSGGKNKEGCCVVDGGDLGVICFEDFDRDECDFLDGDLKKGKMCENVQECVEPPPGEGCCVFGDNDCEEGLGQEGCELDGGVFNAEVMCMDVAQCNIPPIGEGCCVFGPEDCMDDLGIEGCADEMGMFEDGVMCVDVAECNPPPLDGEILYMDNCQACHGVDGAGVPFSPVVGATAEEIDAAIIGEPAMNSLESLSPAEIDAIAAFLDM